MQPRAALVGPARSVASRRALRYGRAGRHHHVKQACALVVTKSDAMCAQYNTIQRCTYVFEYVRAEDEAPRRAAPPCRERPKQLLRSLQLHGAPTDSASGGAPALALPG